MSFTYTANLENNLRDLVRFTIGDRTETGHILEDEEIDALLAMNSNNTVIVSAICAETMAAELTTRQNRTIGDLRIRYSEQAENLYKLAARLRRQMSVALAIPYAGGISVSDKLANTLDTDKVAPAFSIEMQENTGASEV